MINYKIKAKVKMIKHKENSISWFNIIKKHKKSIKIKVKYKSLGNIKYNYKKRRKIYWNKNSKQAKIESNWKNH